MENLDISAVELKEYAISFGWSLVKEALQDGLFVLNSPNQDYTQLIFPKDDDSYKYSEMASISINRLSAFHKIEKTTLIENIREVNDDVISLRYHSNTKKINSLSFQEAFNSIEATKQMILSAGCSVDNPVLYHKRLNRNEATQLLRKTRFRHTKEGSFILKVSCPIELESIPTPTLFGDNNISKPISRKAFEIINKGAYKIKSTIEEGSFEKLLEEQKNQEPYISYNLCDSLINLFDDERELPFELRFNWSRAYLTKLPQPNLPEIVNFPYSFKSKLNELKNYFKPEQKEEVDTFLGTVESLNGNQGDDGKRSGEVILALLVNNEIINTRINLNSEQYDIAYKAHGKGNGYIKIKGRLMPGNRIRVLEDISLFEQVE